MTSGPTPRADGRADDELRPITITRNTYTGVGFDNRILKFDGRPFSEDELVATLEKALATTGVQEVITNVG